MSEVANKFSDDDVAGFVVQNITSKRANTGRPMFNAWFNDVNASRLYVPSARLAAFCRAKGGTWETDPDNMAPSNYAANQQWAVVNEIRRIHPQHSGAYKMAIKEGALGSFRCSKAGKPIWAVIIENGIYSTDTSLGFNSIMPLIIGTRVAPGP